MRDRQRRRPRLTSVLACLLLAWSPGSAGAQSAGEQSNIPTPGEDVRLDAPSVLAPADGSAATGNAGRNGNAFGAAREAGGADLMALTEGASDGEPGLTLRAGVAPIEDAPDRTALSDRIAALGISAESAILTIVVVLPFAYWGWALVARQRRKARRRRRARERAKDELGWQ